MYITVKQAAEKWNIPIDIFGCFVQKQKFPVRIRKAADGKSLWMQKAGDGRYKSKGSLFSQIERKKSELAVRRTMTARERND